jgi:hypothetical protein
MLVFAIALLAGAGVLLLRFFGERRQPEEHAFFYDLSERKLFSAPRTLVPPIRGVNDDTQDGVRAVVIATSGNANDRASRKIAYLEKYAPELKRQVEAMQSGEETSLPAGARITRGAAQSFTFVRRVDEETWYPLNSPEAEKIMTDWQSQGLNGATPAVCVP